MKVVRTKAELRKEIRSLKKAGKKTALVPTMGALHEGHMRLVSEAQKNADAVVVSIFVNPTQFSAGDDFDQYPRQEKRDLNQLEKAEVTLAYLPSVEELYPNGMGTAVTMEGNAEILCGSFRPGHFGGVATIVTKLFMQVMPNVAVFGEKDFQQLHLIEQLCEDLFLPVKIISIHVAREPDGLAMSSRNKYLDEEERKRAPEIFRMLSIMRQRMEDEETDIADLIKWGKNYLKSKQIKDIEYIEIRDEETLAEVTKITEGRPMRILVAVHLGNARLIDNIKVRP